MTLSVWGLAGIAVAFLVCAALAFHANHRVDRLHDRVTALAAPQDAVDLDHKRHQPPAARTGQGTASQNMPASGQGRVSERPDSPDTSTDNPTPPTAALRTRPPMPPVPPTQAIPATDHGRYADTPVDRWGGPAETTTQRRAREREAEIQAWQAEQARRRRAQEDR